MDMHVPCAVIAALAAINAPASAAVLGVDFDSGAAYSVSTTTGLASNIGTFTVGGSPVTSIGALEFAPDGTLYGFTAGPGSLYRFNPTTFAGALVGSLNTSVFEGGLAIAPNGVAYGVNQGNSASSTLFSINLATGQATTIGQIDNGAHDFNGLNFRNDGTLVGLDRVTNSLIAIDPTNPANTSSLGVLSPTVGDIGGMASDGATGWFSTASATGSNSLYAFDLFTGATTLVGGLGVSGTGIAGLAVPTPGALSVFGVAALASRRRR